MRVRVCVGLLGVCMCVRVPVCVRAYVCIRGREGIEVRVCKEPAAAKEG